MSKIGFRTNEETIGMIDRQKRHFGCPDRAAVLRKALALLAVAVEAEKAGGHIALLDRQTGARRRVILS